MSTTQSPSMKRTLATTAVKAGLLATTATLLLAGCVVDRRPQVVTTSPAVVSSAPVVTSSAPPAVVVERSPGPMPAPIVETPAAAPGADWHWVPGHWEWGGHHWRWIRGEWVQEDVPTMPQALVETPPPAPSPTHVWIQGHWRWAGHGSGWVWVRGTWVIA